MSKVPLPEPEAAEEKRAEKVDTGHGLYGFFRDGKVLPTPEEDYRHGTEFGSSHFFFFLFSFFFFFFLIESGAADGYLRKGLVCGGATTEELG